MPLDLVVLQKDAQVLHGALDVLAKLRDIAAEGLRPVVKQAIEGIEQNVLREEQRLSGFCGDRGEPKHEDAKQRQSAMPFGADAGGKVGHSSRIDIQRAENRRDQE